MDAGIGGSVACARAEAGSRASNATVWRRVKYGVMGRDNIANALVDQWIGLEETDDGVWSIYFNTILLATFDERDYIIRG